MNIKYFFILFMFFFFIEIIDMKMMDNDGQDDCIEAITPIKKKKMKQGI